MPIRLFLAQRLVMVMALASASCLQVNSQADNHSGNQAHDHTGEQSGEQSGNHAGEQSRRQTGNRAGNTGIAPLKRPRRIISLDFCADQYVLKLADRDQILALSPDATAAFSYMREAADGLPTLRPVAEEALLLGPDLIVRAYGGGPNAERFFEKAGVPVLTIGAAGTLAAIRTTTHEIAKGLGQPARGEAVIAEMDAGLDAIGKAVGRQSNPQSGSRRLLYITPGGVTTGPGSLIHEMIVAAGLQNFQKKRGWRPIPLERLAHESPDSIATSYFDTHSDDKNHWNMMRHPLARRQLVSTPVVDLPGAWTACGAWFALDAVKALSKAPHHAP